MTNDEKIETCAQAAHAVNRVWCQAHGDLTQFHWAAAPEWQRISAIKGVAGVIAGNGPGASHASWLKEKEATGWKYGPVKNETTKEHPCMVAFDALPPEQREKDHIFVGVVRVMAASLGLLLAECPSSST